MSDEFYYTQTLVYGGERPLHMQCRTSIKKRN